MPKHLPLLLLLLCGVSFHEISAQVQLTDFTFADGDKSSGPSGFVQFNELFFFSAHTQTEGRELWVSDGTAANTRLLKDINPGSQSGTTSLASTVLLGDQLFFMANDGEYGHQLWATKGTSESTRRITQLPGLSAATRLSLVGDQIFFTITSHRTLAVWKSDGTQEGTQLVKGELSIMNTPSFEGSANNLFFFTFQPDGSNDSRVWRSDGSEAGTFPLTEEISGNGAGPSGTSDLTQYIVYKDELYFVARSSHLFSYYNNTGIIKTDGSLEGTQPVMGVHDGYNRLIDVAAVIEVNQKLYFSFFETNYNRLFIWETDGTPAGSSSIYDVYAPAYFTPSNLSTDGSRLIFTGIGTDNTTALLSLTTDNYEVTEIKPLILNPAPPLHRRISNTITRLSDELYHIIVDTSTRGYETWFSDLSATHTVRIDALENKPRLPLLYKGSLYFSGYSEEEGHELWKADLPFSGPELLLNINRSKHGFDVYDSFVALDDKILFGKPDPDIGNELWSYQKAGDEIMLVKDIQEGAESSAPFNLTRFKDHIYFSAFTERYVSALFRSDGTTSGTRILSEPAHGSEIRLITAAKERVYFGSRLTVNRFAICATDGIDTWIVKDLGPNDIGGPTMATSMVFAEDKLFFTTTGSGNDLWISDGTEEGTLKLRDFHQIDRLTLTAVNEKAYFVASENYGEAAELWQSDGTLSGTTRVSNNSAEGFSLPAHLTALNNQLVFSAYTATHGTELWKTDGTAAGTVQIADIGPGSAGAIQSSEFALMDGALYFTANDGSSGQELWKTDGTTNGTVMVMDIWPGEEGARPKNLFSKGEGLYFTAYTPGSGYELWVSQGTASTTRQVFDLSEGPQGSEPSNFMLLDNELFFTAETSQAGRQLWRAGSKNITALVMDSKSDWLKLYPNPTADHLYVDSEGRPIKSLQLFNLNGQPLPLPGQSTNSLYLAHLPAGLYILMIETEGKTFVRKFMKK